MPQGEAPALGAAEPATQGKQSESEVGLYLPSPHSMHPTSRPEYSAPAAQGDRRSEGGSGYLPVNLGLAQAFEGDVTLKVHEGNRHEVLFAV